jgi:hypothetical protein
MNLRAARAEQGLHEQLKNSGWFPKFTFLRKKSFESVHYHPFAGHFDRLL